MINYKLYDTFIIMIDKGTMHILIFVANCAGVDRKMTKQNTFYLMKLVYEINLSQPFGNISKYYSIFTYKRFKLTGKISPACRRPKVTVS